MKQKGLIKPEESEPDVGPFVFYVEAFIELSSSRMNGMSLNPIPFDSVVKYAEVFQVEDLEEFLYILRRMDNTLLELDSKKSAKGNKPNASTIHNKKHSHSGRRKGSSGT